MYNAALRYNDCSELYLSLYSEDTIKYLKSFKGQILIPNKDMPRVGNYYAHTYGTNSISFPFEESLTLNKGYHTFSFNLNKSQLKFKPYNQYIEFSLVSFGDDKHKFTEFAPSNYYSEDNVLFELEQEQKEYEEEFKIAEKNKGAVFFFSILGTGILIYFILNTDKRMRKKNDFYTPSMQVEFFREIPSNLDPNFASNLAFCKDRKNKKNRDQYSAILLSLVRKGYIELERINNLNDWSQNNVKIIIKYQPQIFVAENLESNQESFLNSQQYEPLTKSEILYFNLITKYAINNELPMNFFQLKLSRDYISTNSFVESIDRSVTTIGVNEGYFQKANYTEKQDSLRNSALFLRILGIALITVVNFISYQTHLDLAFGAYFIMGFGCIYSSIYLNKISANYVLFTQFGEDEYAKWRGLYNFLNSETLINERTVVELPLWEQYLVYGTAFGISEKVIKALKIRCPKIEETSMLSNPYYRSHHFHSFGHSFRTSLRTASNIARSNSYGGRYTWRIRIWWRWPRRWRRSEAVIKS